MKSKIVVLVTCGGMETAEKISKALIEKRLAACVNIISGVRSLYRWEGKVQDDNEWLMLIKTREECFEELKALVLDLHPYEVPEIVSLPIGKGHQEYLAWIERETT
jgi:periplasmic divalent cation tolerance protein